MRLISPSVEILQQGPGESGIYEHIELIGKTCYKSTPQGGEKAVQFVDKMVANKHFAMLEHGTVYLRIPYMLLHRLTHPGLVSKYEHNPYSRVNIGLEYCQNWGFDLENVIHNPSSSIPYAYVTTNLRVIYENGWVEDLQYLCKEPYEQHEKRYSARFITDRGVSHELVRHRVFSFAQESTRYCNYSKDKFGNELTLIKPSWYDAATDEQKQVFNDFLSVSEEAYMALLDKWENRIPDRRYKTKLRGNPLTPQQARQVLPNALKTEICMTGFASDWVHFFDLRYRGTTGKPHPDMLYVATELHELFLDKGIEL